MGKAEGGAIGSFRVADDDVRMLEAYLRSAEEDIGPTAVQVRIRGQSLPSANVSSDR